jgi:DNA integrity scanning protein DisA with diadenylate cyclase activity
MAISDRESREEWNYLNQQLKKSMAMEVSIMRELLANMHQEELSLMLQDQSTLNQVMTQRNDMVEKLKHLRNERQDTTQRIVKLIGLEKGEHALEKILPVEEEISTEIFNLRDQIMALSDRMNRQQARNQHIVEHRSEALNLPPTREAQSLPKAKRKAGVTTYPRNEND